MPETVQQVQTFGALLNDNEVAAYLSLSRSMVWRMVSTGDLPEPIKLPCRVTRWRRDDLDRVIRQWAKGAK